MPVTSTLGKQREELLWESWSRQFSHKGQEMWETGAESWGRGLRSFFWLLLNPCSHSTMATFPVCHLISICFEEQREPDKGGSTYTRASVHNLSQWKGTKLKTVFYKNWDSCRLGRWLGWYSPCLSWALILHSVIAQACQISTALQSAGRDQLSKVILCSIESLRLSWGMWEC